MLVALLLAIAAKAGPIFLGAATAGAEARPPLVMAGQKKEFVLTLTSGETEAPELSGDLAAIAGSLAAPIFSNRALVLHRMGEARAGVQRFKFEVDIPAAERKQDLLLRLKIRSRATVDWLPLPRINLEASPRSWPSADRSRPCSTASSRWRCSPGSRPCSRPRRGCRRVRGGASRPRSPPLQRNKGVVAGEVLIAAGAAVEHARVPHRVHPRGALHDLGSAAGRDHHVGAGGGGRMPAQAAHMVRAFAGQVGVEIEKDDGVEIQQGIHEARSIKRSSRGNCGRGWGRCTRAATAPGGRRKTRPGRTGWRPGGFQRQFRSGNGWPSGLAPRWTAPA